MLFRKNSSFSDRNIAFFFIFVKWTDFPLSVFLKRAFIFIEWIAAFTVTWRVVWVLQATLALVENEPLSGWAFSVLYDLETLHWRRRGVVVKHEFVALWSYLLEGIVVFYLSLRLISLDVANSFWKCHLFLTAQIRFQLFLPIHLVPGSCGFIINRLFHQGRQNLSWCILAQTRPNIMTKLIIIRQIRCIQFLITQEATWMIAFHVGAHAAHFLQLWLLLPVVLMWGLWQYGDALFHEVLVFVGNLLVGIFRWDLSWFLEWRFWCLQLGDLHFVMGWFLVLFELGF